MKFDPGEASLPRPADLVRFGHSCWLALDLPAAWTDVEDQLPGGDGLVQRAPAAVGFFWTIWVCLKIVYP